MQKNIPTQTSGLKVARMITLVLALTILNPASSLAQQASPTRIGRNSTKMKQMLEPLAEPIQPCICEVKDGDDRIALGTIVSANGLIVTKLSEVQTAEDLSCSLDNDQDFSAIVVSELPAYDLALLKIDAENLKPIDRSDKEAEVSAGNIVISPDAKGQMISMGITSVDPRRFNMRQPKQEKRGFFGVICRPVSEGLQIGRVTSRSGAQKAGLRPNDILIEFEGNKLPSNAEFIALLEQTSPDDEVSVVVKRRNELMDVTVRLGKAPNFSPQDRWGGGPFNNRRFGFPKVIVHDGIINTTECGGPLVNSDGKVIGINIARSLRISTYAAPMDQVTRFVESYKNK